MLFSIIIPTYNRVVKLERAIKSVLSQTYKDFELIIVDDGGEDETEQVVKSFADPRIKYYWKQNEERSIARNYGISKAEGDYINFLDSDDIQYSHHLQTAANQIHLHEYPKILHLGYEHTTEEGKPILKRNDLDQSSVNSLYLENRLHGNAIFIERTIFTRFRFLHSRNAFLGEDWYLWLVLSCRFQFFFYNEITSCVIQHEKRTLQNIDCNKLEKCVNEIVSELKGNEYFFRFFGKRTKTFFAVQFIFLALQFATNPNQINNAIKYWINGFREDFGIVRYKRFWAVPKNIAEFSLGFKKYR